MKYKDTNGSATSFLNQSARGRINGKLSQAHESVLDKGHPVHTLLKGIASELGFVADRSEDASSDPGNLTSPGVASRMGSRVGADTSIPVEIAARAQRAFELYKQSGQQTGAAKKATLDALKAEYDEIDRLKKRDDARKSVDLSKNVVGSHKQRRGFMERHGF